MKFIILYFFATTALLISLFVLYTRLNSCERTKEIKK